jgi:hypothetical protein
VFEFEGTTECGEEQSADVYYDDCRLYWTSQTGRPDVRQMAVEIARRLAPAEEFRSLAVPYLEILRETDPSEIDEALRVFRFRRADVPPLPTLPEGTEENRERVEAVSTVGPDRSPDSGKPDGSQPQDRSVIPSVSPRTGKLDFGGPTGHGLPVRATTQYVDPSRLQASTPSACPVGEARPHTIGHVVQRVPASGGTVSHPGGSDSSGDNAATEAIAFSLIRRHEESDGWHVDDNGGKGFDGYDMIATRGKGIKYIEVKSSTGTLGRDLSPRQFEEAERHRASYYLYRVYNLEDGAGDVVLYMIQDPWGYLELYPCAHKVVGYKKRNPLGSIRKIVFNRSDV